MQATKKFTIIDYCQYLISSQINYTLTNLADHLRDWSHDTIRNLLRGERITARTIWDKVKNHIEVDENGFLIFDDTVIDKNSSYKIETVRYQYSGNEHKVIKGIGVVSCVYVNPKSMKFWAIDYRVYNPEADGYTKIDHVKNMINNAIHHKNLPFKTVLIDTWYASTGMMMHIDSLQKIFYCPVKKDRRVDDTGGKEVYKKAEEIVFNELELKTGKIVKLKRFPGDKKVRLFQVIVNNEKELIATNDLNQDSSEVAYKICKVRWKIEEFHREIKQTTGIENCQCRKARIQRNHIACAMLVWLRLKEIAYETGKTIYQVKFGQLADYLSYQLRNPSVKMAFS